MIFAQGFLTDGQSIIKEMGSLFVLVLVPTKTDKVININNS